MPKPRDFTPAQSQVIRATARKIWHKQFEWMKAVKATKTSPARPGGQEAMALALGLSQQTISSLLDEKSTYKPGYKVATAIANLDGKTLDDLIGEYAHDDAPESEAPPSGDRAHHDRTTRSAPPPPSNTGRNVALVIALGCVTLAGCGFIAVEPVIALAIFFVGIPFVLGMIWLAFVVLSRANQR